jgi:lipopolysaccharide transport system permease protein
MGVFGTSDTIVTYEPDNAIKKGRLSLLFEIWEDIARNRWLTYQLFRRDLIAGYKQSLAGVLWAFILPLVTVGTFILLDGSGIFLIGDTGVPYPAYAVIGMAYWQIFAMGVMACTNSLVGAGYMIRKINFSKKSLVLASMGQSLISFSVQFCFGCILLLYYHVLPDRAIGIAVILIFPILLFTLGVGFIMALLNGITRDIGTLVSVLSMLLLFITPVLYARPSGGILARITTYNPLYYLISSPRELLLTGSISGYYGYMAAIALSMAIFALGLWAFHLTEARVAERV